MTSINHVSKHSPSQYGSLIDRGANGGIAGADMHVLEQTGRTVSVNGIGNHSLSLLESQSINNIVFSFLEALFTCNFYRL